MRALVWDGAGSRRSELVRSVVGVKTIVQPAYSPELNSAERVFAEVRRWVEGRVYGSLEEKMAAVDECLIPFHSDHDINLGGSLCIVIPAKAGIHSNLVSYNTPTLLRIGISRLEADSERVKSLVSWEWIRRNVQGLSENYAASSSRNGIIPIHCDVTIFCGAKLDGFPLS